MTAFSLFLPLIAQSAVSLVDEFYCHHRRVVPRWERIGHPADTLSLLACVLFALFMAPTSANVGLFGALAIFSCVIITKDEWVHQSYCSGFELWLHSILFVLHPLVCLSLGLVWIRFPEMKDILYVEAALLILYTVYQFFYWNVFRRDETNAGH